MRDEGSGLFEVPELPFSLAKLRCVDATSAIDALCAQGFVQ